VLRVIAEVTQDLHNGKVIIRISSSDTLHEANFVFRIAGVLGNVADNLGGAVFLALTVPGLDDLAEGTFTEEGEDLEAAGGDVDVFTEDDVEVTFFHVLVGESVGNLLLLDWWLSLASGVSRIGRRLLLLLLKLLWLLITRSLIVLGNGVVCSCGGISITLSSGETLLLRLIFLVVVTIVVGIDHVV